jgi:hypothetical protein
MEGMMVDPALWNKIEAVVADGYSGPEPVPQEPVKPNPILDAIIAGMDLAFRPELTQARLREVLDYNPDTGVFTWKVTYKNTKAGDVAGAIFRNKGKHTYYVMICVDSKHYRAHSLAWLWVHGWWPDGIDHIDRDGTNNRMSNLIEVVGPEEKSKQRYNARLSRNNTSGHNGVYWKNDNGKWCATIGNGDGGKSFLGYFTTFEEAVAARQAAEIKRSGCLAEELKDPKNRLQEDTMIRDDVTMADKLAVLRNDNLLKKGTYNSLAVAEAESELGGRYSAAVTKTHVVGSDPTVAVPRQPANSYWSRDVIGMEPPLNYRIDDLEPTGQPFEIAASAEEAQRQSWVVGQMMLLHPEMTRQEAERIYEQVASSVKGGTPQAGDVGPGSTEARSRPSTFKRRI